MATALQMTRRPAGRRGLGIGAGGREGVHVYAWLRQEDARALRRLAAIGDENMSAILRKAIKEFLNRHDSEYREQADLRLRERSSDRFEAR